MSKNSLVLTVLGQDKPGLVEAIATVVADEGANWVESQMAHLAGHFAGVLRVEVEEHLTSQLITALKKLDQLGLELIVHSDDSTLAPHEGTTWQLDLVGQDQPGIVRQITQVLATHCVNVEKFQSERSPAANTGQALFRASARLQLPGNVQETDLQQVLEQVASDMMVDLKIVPKAK